MDTQRVLPQDERYGVTSDGQVWSRCGSRRGWRPLKPTLCGSGYPKVKLGAYYTVMVHTLVARMFHGERPTGMTINHIDGNKANASAMSLEYISQSANNRHAWQIGLQRSGWSSRSAHVRGLPLIERNGVADRTHSILWTQNVDDQLDPRIVIASKVVTP
jgi:hypothetical protein